MYWIYTHECREHPWSSLKTYEKVLKQELN